MPAEIVLTLAKNFPCSLTPARAKNNLPLSRFISTAVAPRRSAALGVGGAVAESASDFLICEEISLALLRVKPTDTSCASRFRDA